MQLKRRHRLSYSAIELMYSCPRKYMLRKQIVSGKGQDTAPSLSYGRAYGAGVQTYLQTQDIDRALFATWKEYYPIEEDNKKDQVRASLAVQAAVPDLDDLLETYTVPAVELGIKIEIDDTHYFVMYVDAILQDRRTGVLSPLEIKTTGLQIHDLTPLYKNSPQGLGYLIALDHKQDRMTHVSTVRYMVSKLSRTYPATEVVMLPFQKTIADRLNWLISLQLDIEMLKQYRELELFPKRNGCLNYMRPCPYFGTCDLLDSVELLSDTYDPAEEPEWHADQNKEYDVVMHLDEIVEKHLNWEKQNDSLSISR